MPRAGFEPATPATKQLLGSAQNYTMIRNTFLFGISGFHGGEYEDDSLQVYSAMRWNIPTFQRCVLHQSAPIMEEVRTYETSVKFYGSTRSNIPEGYHLRVYVV
jgi:hypothetical protein